VTGILQDALRAWAVGGQVDQVVSSDEDGSDEDAEPAESPQPSDGGT
jgi:hypothetical protein